MQATNRGTSSVAKAKSAVLSVREQARALMMQHHRQIKQREQSMLSRAGAKVGLSTEEATRFWNHIQGMTRTSFWTTYDRSHVGMS
ncbi:hypothetical protein [Chroococcidiopsis sp. CCALA 051]|uniref:hypothetical protein n=1 Tax=Chroococcidiopsis sp. CCALA 051 TaxID=869949 RepID=UPI001E5F8390|nr:hypothetical protein [Chroococcidiopsis sp. CCALA 051]